MRCLRKNQKVFHYYLYKDRIPLLDEEDNESGEYELTYHRPVECKGNISVGSGDAQIELFGTNIVYHKVIVIDDPNCPIDTSTLLCVEMLPKSYVSNKTPAHDYIVKAVARSLNSVSIAISKVDADENHS